MANAMTALATITLGSAASSVTFGSIPATYRDLRLVVNGAALVTDNTTIKFNGDTTTTNYNYVLAYGNGTSAASSAANNFGNGALWTTQTVMTMDFLDYSATDKHKTCLTREGNAGGDTEMWATRWASTAAINSIVIAMYAGGNIAAGTVFSLYGIVS